MARNGTGTMTIPNTLVPGEVITASDHNENYSDVAAELTNSLALDGQSTMTGPLKAASGTAAAPGITFGADTDSGFYRAGSNNIGAAVNGAKVLDVSTTGLGVTGAIDVSGAVKRAGVPLIPVGLGPLPWCGLSAPSGWVLCYGQSLSRTTYADLWAFAEAEIALGNPLFTNGNGSTTFTILDMRGYVAAGQDDMGGSSANRLTNADDGINGDTFGATGGGETQVLVTSNLPAYTPAGAVNVSNGASLLVSTGNTQIPGSGTIYLSPATAVNVTATFAGTPQGGTSAAFGILQPTIILNQIIYAGV